MRFAGDGHPVPRDMFFSIGELHLRRKRARVLIQPQNVSARFVDRKLPAARRIEPLIPKEEERKATVHWSRKLVLHNGSCADLAPVRIRDRRRTFGIEERSNLGTEALVPLESRQPLERLRPSFPVPSNAPPRRPVAFESDLRFHRIEDATMS